MPNEIIYFLGAIYLGMFGLLLYLVELKWGMVARLKCHFGYHKRTIRTIYRVVKRYRCVHCSKPQENMHLKIVEGGRKYIDTSFKF